MATSGPSRSSSTRCCTTCSSRPTTSTKPSLSAGSTASSTNFTTRLIALVRQGHSVPGSVHFRAVVLRHGERQRYRLSGEGDMGRVNQLALPLVLARRQPAYVDGVVVTRIRPQPGQVID